MPQIFHTRIADFTLDGGTDGWNISIGEEFLEKDLSIVRLELSSPSERIPDEMKLSFDVPQKDVQLQWHPRRELADSHHYLPIWWRGGRYPCALNRNVPVCCSMNLEGTNALTVAFSDAERYVLCSSGPTEENRIRTEFFLFSEPLEKPVGSVRFSIRIDRRKLFYAESLKEVADWYFSMPEYHGFLPVPERARLPFYSTWYECQKDVSQKKLEETLPFLEPSGLRSVILDDGWQCEAVLGGGSSMRSCGEWIPYPGKFPDLAGMVRSFHRRNISCLLWVALPFVGGDAASLRNRFAGKFLRESPDVSVLDPRCPDVREHLAGVCERLMRDYELDGLKLDFIDEMHLFGRTDPASDASVAGFRDTLSLPDGIARLLSEIRSRVTSVKPDAMIEFRQFYSGPGMWRYGNIFRASDCAHDLLQNRVRTIDLRLLCGPSAVHSDMMIWSPEDSPEVAALQILNALFSVPQISVGLERLPPGQREMLGFWMRFAAEHRTTLQEGGLQPLHPELSYPVVSAVGAGERITAVYSPGQVVRFERTDCWIVVNASHTGSLCLEIPAGRIDCFDCSGHAAGSEQFPQGGIVKISVPQSGFLRFNAL